MTALPKKKIYTPEEYLALEEVCEYRSEYDDGLIIAMAGGTREHIRISSNIEKSLDKQLFGTCETFQSEMKVWVETLNKFYYPDVTVVCGEIKYYKKRRDALENPIVLVEVLSESTKIYDKEDKFFAYQNIETFREYLLVHQDKALIGKKIRVGNIWLISAFKLRFHWLRLKQFLIWRKFMSELILMFLTKV